MYKFCLIFIVYFCSLISIFGQENSQTIGAIIDDLTQQWDLEADNLDDYDGLSNFCVNESYRVGIIKLLEDVHHYDSVLYERLVKASRFSDDNEIKKTLAEIEKFEEGYDMRSFIHFLHEECSARSDIEKHAADSKSDIGVYSYDGQVYVLENELAKFVHHITKRLDNIREHTHRLHLK